MQTEQILHEKELQPRVVIREFAIAQDVFALRTMHAASWLATYPNEEAGVSYEWVKARVDSWILPENIEESINYFETVVNDPAQFYRVAEVDGEIVGCVHAATKGDNTKVLAALYVSPDKFGLGIGKKLMKAADEWIGGIETTLEVVAYNTRARGFYEKHGFREIPDSDYLFAHTMPAIKMIRKGVNHEI